MSLPTTGPLKFSDIYTEIHGSHTTQLCSLRTMSSDASFVVPDAISEFYGYTSKGLSVDQDTFTGVTYKGGTGIVQYTVQSVSVNWTASATTNPSSFITIQSGGESGGDGNELVKVNILSNSNTNNTRYGEITIKDSDTSDPAPDVIVKITQNKKYYFSTSSTFELAATANDSDSVSISTNVSSWTASVNTNFPDNSLSVSTNGTTITVTVSTANSGASPRTGDILVHDNSTSDPADDLIIAVSQAGSQNIVVNPNVFTGVSWRGDTVSTTVDATNTDWDSNKVSWVTTVSPPDGVEGSTNVDIDISSNTDTSSDRYDAQAVTISSYDGSIDKYISITQNYKRYISASNKTFDYDATSGTVTIGGNVASTWDVDSHTSNFLNIISKQDDTTLSVTMNVNTSTSDKTDTVTLKDTGTDPADSITITLTQEGAPATLTFDFLYNKRSLAIDTSNDKAVGSVKLYKTDDTLVETISVDELFDSSGETTSLTFNNAVSGTDYYIDATGIEYKISNETYFIETLAWHENNNNTNATTWKTSNFTFDQSLRYTFGAYEDVWYLRIVLCYEKENTNMDHWQGDIEVKRLSPHGGTLSPFTTNGMAPIGTCTVESDSYIVNNLSKLSSFTYELDASNIAPFESNGTPISVIDPGWQLSDPLDTGDGWVTDSISYGGIGEYRTLTYTCSENASP